MKLKIEYCCPVCDSHYFTEQDAKACLAKCKNKKYVCSFCKKDIKKRNFSILEHATEVTIVCEYGSKLDGLEMKAIICDDCVRKINRGDSIT